MENVMNLLMGFGTVFSPENLGVCLLGSVLGLIVGAMPGIGSLAGCALLLPLTYKFDPTAAIIMLGALYYSNMYGGAFSAILLNVPGDSPAVMTVLDGHPMAEKGQPGQALFTSNLASCIGGLVGMFNGLIISKTEIPPFIVTLASMNITKGIALVYTNGAPIRCMTDAFKFPGAGYVGPIPVPVILMLVVFVIVVLIVNRTHLGRHIYAVGGNAQAAKFSGINVEKVKFLVYTYTGIMAGIAGMVVASRLYSGQPTAGDGAEMDAIAAVVVGGTSMSGGSGRLGGTLIGVLIIGVLNNGLNLLGVDSNWQYIVKGLVILLAVYVDFLRNKKAGR